MRTTKKARRRASNLQQRKQNARKLAAKKATKQASKPPGSKVVTRLEGKQAIYRHACNEGNKYKLVITKQQNSE